ncbi:hypothetical protein FRC02_003063 [Tulasnella sp. 418]|nr:hypothetical protein FRC02_003063 [Tulasnella sp. 418]
MAGTLPRLPASFWVTLLRGGLYNIFVLLFSNRFFPPSILLGGHPGVPAVSVVVALEREWVWEKEYESSVRSELYADTGFTFFGVTKVFFV